jgi:DNA helicase-2/ATP-dependent DNA helicase PcrA
MADQIWTDGTRKFRYNKVVEAQEGTFPAVPAVIRVGAADGLSWHEEVLAFLHRLRDSGRLADWNQVAFLFRSVKSDKVTALASYLENAGIPVYSPRSNMFFDREEVRLVIGALIFLFPQFQKVRKWNADAHLDIWYFYDQRCFFPFTEELRKPENARLLSWARPLAKRHHTLAQNTDYSFSGLFYQPGVTARPARCM